MKDLLVALGTVVLTVVVNNLKTQQGQPQNVTPSVSTSTAAQPAVLPAPPQKMSPSVAQATQVIDAYVKKHPSAKNTPSLRRLSAATKARPEQNQALAEATARRIAHSPITPKEEAMLEEAAALAEREGLTPQEMAEFMKKWERDLNLNPRVAGKPETSERAPLPSFDGTLRLIYRFEGTVHCGNPPCLDIPVSARVSAGAWVETREGKTDASGHYVLELPVFVSDEKKVAWRLQAHTRDLRKTELSGEHRASWKDPDVTLQNDLRFAGQ